MKTGKLVQGLVCLGLMICVGCSTTMDAKSGKAGEQSKQMLNKKITKVADCNYLLYLPADYGKGDKKWPLIMFLHGAGERGNNLEKLKKQGLPKMVSQGKNFDFIIVSPQCPNDMWWPEKTDLANNTAR